MIKKSDYIFLKAFIPRRMQIAIRQELIRRKLPLVKDVWPICETASKAPEGWKGWPDGKKFALVLTHDVETEKGTKNSRLFKNFSCTFLQSYSPGKSMRFPHGHRAEGGHL